MRPTNDVDRMPHEPVGSGGHEAMVIIEAHAAAVVGAQRPEAPGEEGQEREQSTNAQPAEGGRHGDVGPWHRLGDNEPGAQ